MTKETYPPYLEGCDAAVNVLRYPELARFQTNVAEAQYHPLKHHRDSSEYVSSYHFSNMVTKRRKDVKCFTCKTILIDDTPLKAHDQQYHPISMNEGLSLDGISTYAGCDWPEPLWFDFSWCTWMAIAELSQLSHLPIDDVHGTPPAENTSDEETIGHQMPDLICTPDPTKTRAHRQVAGVENAEGKAYGKATGFYNKHCKYSEQRNPWHPFQSVHNFQQAQSFGQQTKTWIDQHLRRGLYNFNIKIFQSVDAVWKPISRLNFGLGNDSRIEDYLPDFGTLYYRDILNCIQFLLAHLPFQVHLNFKQVRLEDLDSRRIYSEMNRGDWWWDMQDQLPAGATIVPVICASHKTHSTHFSAGRHAWPLHHMIGNVQKNMYRTPKQCAMTVVGLISCPPKRGKNTDEAWHSAVGTALSPLLNFDNTGPGMQWDFADGLQRQWYPPLAACVGDYLEQVMVAQVSYGLYRMLEIPTGVPIGRSTVWPVEHPHDPHVYWERLDETNIKVLHNLGVYPICNLFWQYPLCNIYRLMNSISCSWVQFRTDCTGCSNTWKLEMSRINLTIDSHQYHDMQASDASLNHLIRWKVTPGRELTSRGWSEHWQSIAL